jgi:hypothetical protein
MRNIVECLAASVDSINRFAYSLAKAAGGYSEDEDDIYEELERNSPNGPKKNYNQIFKADILKNVDQCLECFQLAVTLLARYVFVSSICNK